MSVSILSHYTPRDYMSYSPRASGLLKDLCLAADNRASNGSSLKMATDVSDTAEAYTIKAELPGVPKESVTVEVHRNVVTIEAVKEEQRKEDTETLG
jgi:HSP20 family protein